MEEQTLSQPLPSFLTLSPSFPFSPTLYPTLYLTFSVPAPQSRLMECQEAVVFYMSWALLLGAVAFLLQQIHIRTPYGRYRPVGGRSCPARLAWFLQEVPALLLPLLLLLLTEAGGSKLLLCAFMLHYLHR